LAWVLAKYFSSGTAMDPGVMKMRLAGAVLLTIAVIVAVAW
jgi:hypothetical protein